MEQVYEVCDKITVLRNGELVGEYDVENLPRVQLVAKMMGKDFDDLADIKSERSGEVKEGDPVIEAVGVSHHGRSNLLILHLTKVKWLVLPVFLAPDVLNL